jgi:hypothetical protein
MGFMDKVKAQTEVAMAKGQQAMKDGQARIDGLQDKKASDGLFRDLGAAYYATQRSGGPQAAVDSALAALDAHAAGAVASPATGGDATSTDAASTDATSTEGGSFNLDDV